MTFDAADIVNIFIWIVFGMFLVSVTLAVLLNRTVKRRFQWLLGITSMFVVALLFAYYFVVVRPREIAALATPQASPSANTQYSRAKALFDLRCKTAGEKIIRTVDHVDGIFLSNIRPSTISSSSQYDSDDQYGYNVGGDNYIRYYLVGSVDLVSRYRYVEAEVDSQYVRYTTPLSAAESRHRFVAGGGVVPIENVFVKKLSSRYAVEWKDISTKEDRDLWIAGGSLRVTDRQSGEVIAERIGYLIDSGQGNTGGHRQPWPWARYYSASCPNVATHNRVFVEKVLKPPKEDK